MRRSFLILVAAGALLWDAQSGLAAVPNANSIPCPAAPAGWTSPPGEGGRTVLSPNPLDATSAADYTVSIGTDQVTVICGYDRSGKNVKVTVNYALPTADFNPYADFDLGCTTKSVTRSASTGDLAWTAKGRAFRVVSLTDWAYAGFRDPTDQLASSDVDRFEAVARTLLKHSGPAAHDCTLPGKGGPTAVPPKSWTVAFTSTVTSNNFTTSATLMTSPFSASAVLTGNATATSPTSSSSTSR